MADESGIDEVGGDSTEQEQVEIVVPEIVIDQAFVEKRPLSYSSLKHFRKSPRHYVKYVTRPKKISDAMFLGSIIDTLVLTPELFDKRYMIIGEKPNTKTKDGKAAWAEILGKASSQKQLLCTKEQLQTAKFCRESLMSNIQSQKLLECKLRTQVRLEWRDKPTNLPCLGIVDFESNAWDEDWCIDLKSTADADPDEFNKDIFKEDYQYYFQGGSYLVGYHRAKYRFPYFVNMAVETAYPYNVSVNFYDAKIVEFCKQEFLGTLQAFRYCLSNNLFHQGYEFRLAESLNYFSVQKPGWVKPKYSEFGERS